jgi:hypothetical protein
MLMKDHRFANFLTFWPGDGEGINASTEGATDDTAVEDPNGAEDDGYETRWSYYLAPFSRQRLPCLAHMTEHY